MASCGGGGGGGSPSATPSLTGISISPNSASIPKGESQQLSATGQLSNGTTEDLTASVAWTSSNPAVASVTASGVATGLGTGSTMIQAVKQGVTASASLDVTAAVLISVAVFPASATLDAGQTQQFTATGTYSDKSTANITDSIAWQSSNVAIATISAAGLAKCVAQGAATITASSTGLTANAALSINPPGLVSITIAPPQVSLAKGQSQQLAATGNYTDGSTQNLTAQVVWSSSNTAVASVTAGLVKTNGEGGATVSAALDQIQAADPVFVSAPALVSISVTPSAATVAQGLSQQFTATGTYTDNSTQNITSSAAWSSSNTAVATINNTGLATSLQQGSTAISAAVGTISGTALLSVGPPQLLSITVSPQSPSIPKGLTLQFSATANYSNNTQQNVTNTAVWNSSNTGVATVTAGGLASAVGQGTTVISASYGGLSGSTTLTVGPPQLVSISVTPSSAQVAAGQTQQFTATGTYTDGSMQNITNSAAWSSSNTAVATVSNAGLATGVAQGNATITAASGGISGTASLTVTPPILVSIQVTPATVTLPLGSPQQFTATGIYSDNSQQDLTSQAAWNSTNSNIANLGNPGLATAEGVGSCMIQAVFDSITGSAQLTVISGAQLTVTVLPQLTSLTLMQPQQYQAYVQGTTNQNVTWAVDGVTGGNSSVGTISASGLYTPPSTAGTHTITAISQADPTYSGSASLWVSDYAGMFNYRNDLSSTGQNLDEAALTTPNVNYNTFGKLFSCPVDGDVYAQPLYIANYPINGGVHNVVIVTTENDSVYAFDADSLSCQPLWQTTLLTNGGTPIPDSDLGNGDCTEIYPQVGTTGTPVIDLPNNAVFMVAASLEGPSNLASSYVHRLHSLNLATGQEMPQSPVQIAATVPGTGAGSVDGMLSFNGQQHKSRTALQLVNGQLFFAFGSDCDVAPFHGWVFAYDEFQLTQTAVYATTPNGTDGGIWLTGAGLTFDASNNMYVVTGNGTFDGNLSGGDYGDSILKFSLTGGALEMLDSFTPSVQATLEEENLDLATSTLLLLPDQPGPYPHLGIVAGKSETIYVLNRDDLGGYNSGGDQVVQEVSGELYRNFGTPGYWNENVYFCALGDYVKAFQLNNGTLTTSWTSESPTIFNYPGSIGSISSASSTSSSAVLWILDNSGFGNNQPPSPAILHAYDATNLANELYNSTQAPNNRDQADNAEKFTVSTVANGKVYFGTQGFLDVYGLLPGQPPQIPNQKQ